jgi:hypothetical protein
MMMEIAAMVKGRKSLAFLAECLGIPAWLVGISASKSQ